MSPEPVTWPPKGLAKPAHRALARAGIDSLETLAARSEAELAALHGLGPNGVLALKTALAAQGLALRR
jgi:hypothetical protein